ncbi:unnamed protein product [Protopolystoma xenopodis]|uniref:Uncharacterized protein n=1 Tax=Protopolystoma xenopodis TaxID=117903 RepID=A0A3S5BL60_9PLAT|nr:unnamed protein product [Protopolystoma xenopodis]
MHPVGSRKWTQCVCDHVWCASANAAYGRICTTSRRCKPVEEAFFRPVDSAAFLDRTPRLLCPVAELSSTSESTPEGRYGRIPLRTVVHSLVGQWNQLMSNLVVALSHPTNVQVGRIL